MRFENEQALEEFLSRPNEADLDAMRAMGGDLLLIGVNGKMGPSLAIRARRAADLAGVKMRVIGASRFSSDANRKMLEDAGVETISADVLDEAQLAALPDCPNVVSMAARKFGSTGDEPYTWAMNAYMPARVAVRFKHSRIVAFSSGNVYPLTPVAGGGATEDTPLVPVGEYAMSAVARERLLSHLSRTQGTPMTILRLNYAVEMRYGVLLDIGTRVQAGQPVSLSMGNANVIWQGDANSVCLRSFGIAASPPTVLNLTGPETLSVRYVASVFARHFETDPVFEGAESPNALLNNAARCFRLFGYPTVSLDELIEWTAEWITRGGRTLNKPTHFEARDGKF
ncbi:MAG: NAD(P)-dependent oxidoreductase [Acidobacteria bacterium]|nr:NAD(P)-dependent oxidoreductase [Acidobacteriota bacterium]